MASSMVCMRAFAAAALAVPLPSQLVTMTATETTAGFLRAEHFNVAPLDLRPIPALANLTPGLWLQAASGGASAVMALQVVQGFHARLEALVSCSVDTMASPHGAAVSSSADLVLQLHAFQPVHGVVAVWIRTVPSGGAPGLGDFQVDVDADGTWDVAGNPWAPPFEVAAELWRAFGPGALPIRIAHAGSVSVPPAGTGDYLAHLVVRWYPLTGPVTAYGTPCGLELGAQRAPNGDLVFRLSPPPAGSSVLLFGTTAANAPLALPPYCTQWTSFDTHVWWPSGDLTIASVALPIAFLMHAQAATFVSPQATPLSNGLRLFVGP